MTSEDALTRLSIPHKFETPEQKVAYQDFINVLSAILVKYSASVENKSDS